MNLVGIPGQIGKTTLRGYSLTVDGKNMDAYVDAGSMRPLRSRAEGEKLWEYWSEIMRVELDVDCFGILGIDSTSYTTLYKKRAQLWFNNKVILDGSLGEPEYDWDTQRLTIEIQSLGRILKELKINSNFENRVLRGDTAENAVNALIYLFINPQLEAAGYPLRAAGSSVNVVDFSFYKSLDFDNNNIVGSFSIFYNGARYYMDNNINRPTAIYTDASGNAWLGRSLIIDERDFLYLIKITESGVSATQKIVLDGDYLEARPEFITDQSVIEFIKKFLSNHALISVVKINDTYFALSVLQSSMRAWFSKIVVDPTDYYIYKFEAGA
ncbi:MAG: hypothetical protein KDD04_05905, partial [Sinomicrobium sp.]|nr:hypothetical protein [Sinomicrobium sp.]